VPELLFLDTFGIGGEVSHQILDFIALLLSIGVNDFGEVSHQPEVRAHRVGQTSELTKLRDQSDLVASAAIFIDEQRLIGFLDFFVVAGLVVRDVTGHLSLLVEFSQRRLGKVDAVDLVGLLVVPSDNSGSSELSIDVLTWVFLVAFSALTELIQILEHCVGSHNFEADINVEKSTVFSQDHPRVETRPHLDLMRIQRMSICRVESFLSDGLELESSHHRVEEDLHEVEVVLVMLFHDLDPLNGDGVGLAFKFAFEFRQLGDLFEREDAEAPINVEIEVLFDLVTAEFEDLLAHFTGVVGDLRLVLAGVLVDTGDVLLVEVDLEVVRVELEGFAFFGTGAGRLLGEESG